MGRSQKVLEALVLETEWRLMLISAGESDWLCWCRLGLSLFTLCSRHTNHHQQPTVISSDPIAEANAKNSYF